jgi:hypothetical protein
MSTQTASNTNLASQEAADKKNLIKGIIKVAICVSGVYFSFILYSIKLEQV